MPAPKESPEHNHVYGSLTAFLKSTGSFYVLGKALVSVTILTALTNGTFIKQ